MTVYKFFLSNKVSPDKQDVLPSSKTLQSQELDVAHKSDLIMRCCYSFRG